MADWTQASDQALARLELARDPLASYVSADQLDSLALGALSAGEEAGFQVLERHGMRTPEALSRVLGVAVAFSDKPQMEGYQVRAEYQAGCVILYRSEIRRTVSLGRSMLASLTEETVASACLAHELFHHLEETEFGRLSDRLAPATILRLGPWRWQRPIRQVREVGAHRFAQVLTGLPYLPVLWDYLLLLTEGKVTEQELRRRILPEEIAYV